MGEKKNWAGGRGNKKNITGSDGELGGVQGTRKMYWERRRTGWGAGNKESVLGATENWVGGREQGKRIGSDGKLGGGPGTRKAYWERQKTGWGAGNETNSSSTLSSELQATKITTNQPIHNKRSHTHPCYKYS